MIKWMYQHFLEEPGFECMSAPDLSVRGQTLTLDIFELVLSLGENREIKLHIYFICIVICECRL